MPGQVTQIALIYTGGKANLPRKHGDMEKIAVIARDRNVIAVTGKLNLTADPRLRRDRSTLMTRICTDRKAKPTAELINGRLLTVRISFLI